MYLKSIGSGLALALVAMVVYFFVRFPLRQDMAYGVSLLKAGTIGNPPFWALSVAAFALGFFLVFQFR